MYCLMTYWVFYLLGLLLVSGALGYGAYLLGVSPEWVGVVLALVLGMGLIGVAKNRRG